MPHAIKAGRTGMQPRIHAVRLREFVKGRRFADALSLTRSRRYIDRQLQEAEDVAEFLAKEAVPLIIRLHYIILSLASEGKHIHVVHNSQVEAWMHSRLTAPIVDKIIFLRMHIRFDDLVEVSRRAAM